MGQPSFQHHARREPSLRRVTVNVATDLQLKPTLFELLTAPLRWAARLWRALTPSPVQRRRRSWGRSASHPRAFAFHTAPASALAPSRLDARGLQSLLAAEFQAGVSDGRDATVARGRRIAS
jgi:hypothetical protein